MKAKELIERLQGLEDPEAEVRVVTAGCIKKVSVEYELDKVYYADGKDKFYLTLGHVYNFHTDPADIKPILTDEELEIESQRERYIQDRCAEES